MLKKFRLERKEKAKEKKKQSREQRSFVVDRKRTYG